MKHHVDIHIKFCFPNAVFSDVGSFANALTSFVSKIPEIGYGGYARKKDLFNDLEERFENSQVSTYTPVENKKKVLIQKNIQRIIHLCVKKLPYPQKTLYVFVFPWPGPFDSMDKMMGRVSGFTPHKNVIHLFVDSQSLPLQPLKRAVVHEYNHAVFFQYHPSLHPFRPSAKPRVLDIIFWEGLAENFEIEAVGLSPAPYALALGNKEAHNIFHTLPRRTLESDSVSSYEELFFGAGKYKFWSGYSIGYRLVHAFRKKHPEIPWKKLISMRPEDVFQ